MITPISSSFLKDLIGPPTFGDPTRRFPIVTIALPHKPQAGAIHFDLKSASKNIKLPTPSVWVLPQPPQNQDLSDNPEIWIYITSRPKRLMAVVFEAMDGRKKIKNDYRNYQGAWVHKTAQLDESIQLSPNVIVGAYVQIGRQTRLFPGVHIDHYAQIGSHCVIKSHSVIGTPGFNNEIHDNQRIHLPHLGNVVIEDEVWIGSLVNIDRATLGATRIGSSSAIDSHSHIAHNCQIGAQATIAGGFMCAGSVTIGKRFTCGGAVLIKDHIFITDDVTLAGHTIVISDILEKGVYMGFPHQPYAEGLKTLQVIKELPQWHRHWRKLFRKNPN